MHSSGFLLINKPSGPTSHDIVNMARKKLGTSTPLSVKRMKVGHTGTLDPFASGLLILLIGREATKRQSEFLKLDKTYLATAVWGYTSDTYDVTGRIVKNMEVKELQGLRSFEDLEKVLEKFQGEIVQTVPAFSAVKVGGQRLYKIARNRKDRDLHSSASPGLSLPKRRLMIYKFETTERSPLPSSNFKKFLKQNFIQDDSRMVTNFLIKCSSGTYIRSLIHDLGKEIGCGALVGSLHRTKINDYCVEDAIAPEKIDWKYVMQMPYSPADTACSTSR